MPTILYYITCFSTLIPIFFLLKKKNNFKIPFIGILGILLFIAGLSDLIFYFLEKKYKIANSGNIVSNIYTLFEFFLLNYIYYSLFKKKTLTYIASFLFIAFFIINTFYIQSFSQYQSWLIVLEGVIFIIFSVKYYRQLLNNTSDLLVLPSFWLNTGIYLYFALDLFLFIITSYMIKNMSEEMRDTVWGFHNFINTIKNILFAVGIYFVNAKQEKEYNK